MNYKIYTSNGQRLVINADRFEQDGSGTRLYSDETGIIASFYCGEVAQIFPEDTVIEATTE